MAPAEAEKAATASLPAQIASSLCWNETSLFDASGEFSGVRFDVSFRQRPAPEIIAAAQAALAPWLQPLDRREAVKALAQLRLLVRRRNETNDDLDAQTALYAAKLEAYPADVVVHVIGKWADREEWWPSWAELKAQCDRHSRRRMALKAALAKLS